MQTQRAKPRKPQPNPLVKLKTATENPTPERPSQEPQWPSPPKPVFLGFGARRPPAACGPGGVPALLLRLRPRLVAAPFGALGRLGLEERSSRKETHKEPLKEPNLRLDLRPCFESLGSGADSGFGGGPSWFREPGGEGLFASTEVPSCPASSHYSRTSRQI